VRKKKQTSLESFVCGDLVYVTEPVRRGLLTIPANIALLVLLGDEIINDAFGQLIAINDMPTCTFVFHGVSSTVEIPRRLIVKVEFDERDFCSR